MFCHKSLHHNLTEPLSSYANKGTKIKSGMISFPVEGIFAPKLEFINLVSFFHSLKMSGAFNLQITGKQCFKDFLINELLKRINFVFIG